MRLVLPLTASASWFLKGVRSPLAGIWQLACRAALSGALQPLKRLKMPFWLGQTALGGSGCPFLSVAPRRAVCQWDTWKPAGNHEFDPGKPPLFPALLV